MTSQEMELQVLLKELEHADKQISSFMELQMKILGVVFTLLAATLGLLFTNKVGIKLEPQNIAILLVIISVVGSFGVMQSIINYGISLGYMHNKQDFISPRLKDLIKLKELPLQAVTAFESSPAKAPVLFATATVAAGIAVLNAVVLWQAWGKAGDEFSTKIYISLAGLLLISTLVCQALIGKAMKKIGISHKK